MGEKEVIYSEIFKRSGYDSVDDARNKIQAVKDFYQDDESWEVGQAEIIQEPNGKYMVRIPLKKYKLEQKGHSR